MVKNQWNLSQLKNGSLIISLLFLSLGMIHPAQAEYGKPETENGNDAPNSQSTGIGGTRYRKPETEGGNDAPNSQSTGVAATRSGSCNPADNNLKANAPTFATLAPYEHVGQSANTNPTFTWYIRDHESYPVKFGLYEFDPDKYYGKGKQVYQTSLSSSMGMMTHGLPTEVSLDSGKTYVWEVAVICNPNDLSHILLVYNHVKIVQIDPSTISQLDNTEDLVTKANIYAQSGLWYDAIAELAVLPDDPQARDATIKLISQLSAMEDNSSEVKNQNTHQQNLELIIESLRQQ